MFLEGILHLRVKRKSPSDYGLTGCTLLELNSIENLIVLEKFWLG